MMVRNEADILLECLGHLLRNLAVDGVLVADNGSQDATREVLAHVAWHDPRLRWLERPGRFDQHAITSELAAEARAAGADWILPVDADEFFDPGPAGWRPLAEAPEAGAFTAPVRNFVQWPALNWLRGAAASALHGMVVSADPIGDSDSAQAQVEAGEIPFIAMAYPPKLLFRAAAGLAIARGAHWAEGIAGAVRPFEGAAFLHAPIRSFGDLHRRVEHGARLAAADPDPTTGWHVRRLVGLSSAGLKREWRANTWGSLPPPGCRRQLRFDLRLARIARSLAGFRAEMQAGRRPAMPALERPAVVPS